MWGNVTESNATESDATGNDATKIHATGSDVTESDATKSNVTDNGATESGATESDATGSGARERCKGAVRGGAMRDSSLLSHSHVISSLFRHPRKGNRLAASSSHHHFTYHSQLQLRLRGATVFFSFFPPTVSIGNYAGTIILLRRLQSGSACKHLCSSVSTSQC